MSEDQEKVRKAMNVMAKPQEKILSPTETVDRRIHQANKEGFKVAALAFGQAAFVSFARDLEKNGPKKLKLVDVNGDPLQDEEIQDVKMYKGMKVYKKSTPGFEPLFV